MVSQNGQERVIQEALELCPSEKLTWSTGEIFPARNTMWARLTLVWLRWSLVPRNVSLGYSASSRSDASCFM